MHEYIFNGRIVRAVQWAGQPVEGVTIVTRRWGDVGEVETARGKAWVSPGDWLVDDGEARVIVTPAVFAQDYTAVEPR